MRPIRIEQNSFRYPLNILLGTEAQIRLLRVLTTEVNGSISPADAADRAGLTPLGAKKALRKLTETGFVRAVGGGRKQQYEVAWNDTLVQTVVALFNTERERYDYILASIRRCIDEVEIQPVSAWIASLPANPADPMKVCILQEAMSLNMTVHDLRKLLQGIESELDMTIEVTGYTRADTIQPGTGSIHLYGLPLIENSDVKIGFQRGPASHEEIDQRLARTCLLIAKMISEDSSIIERAKRHTRRILKGPSGPAARDVEEWMDILEQCSVRRLIQFLSSNEERATRLRQSCPFLAVMNQKEKQRISEELGSDL